MTIITFNKEKGQLHINGILMAEGESEEISRDDEQVMVGMAFGPPKENSKTLEDMVNDGELEFDEFTMALSLLHVMFPGGVNMGLNLTLTQQDIQPWLDNLDSSLEIPDIGTFALTLPTESEDEDESAR